MNGGALTLADALLRFATIGELLLAIAVIVRAPGRSVGNWLAAGFLAGLIAYLLLSSAMVAAYLGALRLPLLALAAVAGGMLWLLSRALFQDEFRLEPLHWLPIALLEACGLYAAYGQAANARLATAAGLAHQAIVVLLYADAIWRSWRGYAADLVEPRRSFRPWFIAVASVTGLAIVAAEVTLRGREVPDELEFAKVVAIFALTSILLAWSLDLKAGWFAGASRARPETEAAPGERQLLVSLRESMEVGRAYRQEGLTIAALARQLKVPEHLLRKVINQRLGHRNFNAFLNAYRIAEAKASLAHASRERIPVLTIALESGFGSIGPFNRAFREAVGMTPTEYRRERLGLDTGAAHEEPLPKVE